tara:strand:+ start:4263 stop:5084 length:822 start_codon:yes stop_codon:yes gene_type:complete
LLTEIIEPLLLIFIGAAIGTYAGAIGAGGGFLIAPFLLFRYPTATAAEITAASLLYVVVNSALQILVAFKEDRIDGRLVVLLAAIGVPAAVVGGATTGLVPRDYFAIGFGVFLVLIGMYVIVRPTAVPEPTTGYGWERNIKDRNGTVFRFRVPLIRSALAQAATAFFSALAGIGGGPIGMPVITRVQKVPHEIAVPSMHLLIFIQSISVTGLHIVNETNGSPLGDLPWLAAGVIISAPLAAKFRRIAGEGKLMRALAIGLIAIGASAVFDIFR